MTTPTIKESLTLAEACTVSAPELSVAPGSVSDSVALRTAVYGYMCDRQTLIESMPALNLEYEVHRKKRAWIIEEITRIDVAVAALLSPNTAVRRAEDNA